MVWVQRSFLLQQWPTSRTKNRVSVNRVYVVVTRFTLYGDDWRQPHNLSSLRFTLQLSKEISKQVHIQWEKNRGKMNHTCSDASWKYSWLVWFIFRADAEYYLLCLSWQSWRRQRRTHSRCEHQLSELCELSLLYIILCLHVDTAHTICLPCVPGRASSHFFLFDI